MDNKITVILADGTEITGLKMNGNNFVSPMKIDEKIFDGNLSTVTIVKGEEETTYHNMSLIHCTKYDSEYWFALRELTETELVAIKNRSDIDYIALVCDVEL